MTARARSSGRAVNVKEVQSRRICGDEIYGLYLSCWASGDVRLPSAMRHIVYD